MTHPPPPEGWPTVAPFESPWRPRPEPVEAHLPAVHQAAPLTEYMRDPYSGVLVRVLQAQHLPDQPAPAPAARSGIDPVAQRIIAAGAVSPLLGWGGAMFFGALAGATTGVACLAVCLLAVWLMQSTGGRRGAVNVSVNVNQKNR